MKRQQLVALAYIVQFDALSSVLERGIISRGAVIRSGLHRVDLADAEVLARRELRILSTGRPLLEHVNLYLNARNAMLFRLTRDRDDIAVLRVEPSVLDLPGTRVTVQNAATTTEDYAPEDGLARIEPARLFSIDFNDPELKRETMAEVLVAQAVPPDTILEVRVATHDALRQVAGVVPRTLRVTVDPYLFMQKERP